MGWRKWKAGSNEENKEVRRRKCDRLKVGGMENKIGRKEEKEEENKHKVEEDCEREG